MVLLTNSLIYYILLCILCKCIKCLNSIWLNWVVGFIYREHFCAG